MLLQNGLVGPSLRPVEFHHDGLASFDADLVDAVLIAVQWEQPAIPAQAGGFHSVQDVVRPQIAVRCKVLVWAHRSVLLGASWEGR